MTSSFALTKNVYFSPAIVGDTPSPCKLFRHVYSNPSIFHPDVSVSTPDPSLIYLLRYIQPQRFVYVAIRLFRPHKYLTPFWKSHLHVGTKCVWYHYCHTPTFNRPSARQRCRQLDEFPGTLYFTIFTFYRSSPRTLAIQVVMQTTKLRRNRAYNRYDCTRLFFKVLLDQTLWSRVKKKFETSEIKRSNFLKSEQSK